MVENRPLDVTLSDVDLSTLSAEQRLLRKQWQDAVASGATKTHPYAVNRDTTDYPDGVALDVDPYEGYVPPNPNSGGGVDPTPLIDAAVDPLDARLEVVEEALPDKADSEQVDTKIAQNSKFRGEWTTGELVWADDFSAGFNPGPNNIWSVASGTPGAITMAGADGRNANEPAYPNLLSLGGDGSVVLHLNRIPALAGKTVNGISFYSAQAGGTSDISQGGVNKWGRNPGAFPAWSPWLRETVVLASGANLTFNGHGFVAYFTGLELTAAARPYMLGEYVIYQGKTYKSKADNNGTTPGQSASWELLIDAPPPIYVGPNPPADPTTIWIVKPS